VFRPTPCCDSGKSTGIVGRRIQFDPSEFGRRLVEYGFFY
jgi:hypothetical protein